MTDRNHYLHPTIPTFEFYALAIPLAGIAAAGAVVLARFIAAGLATVIGG